MSSAVTLRRILSGFAGLRPALGLYPPAWPRERPVITAFDGWGKQFRFPTFSAGCACLDVKLLNNRVRRCS
jgi:hypothetical protein